MPETRTVKGFSEVGLPLAEGDFESSVKKRTWRNLTEDKATKENPENSDV